LLAEKRERAWAETDRSNFTFGHEGAVVRGLTSVSNVALTGLSPF
jgi:hypothetical protein